MTDNRHLLASNAAYGRFKARFKPGGAILAFHDRDELEVMDISEIGCKLANAGGRFEAERTYPLDLVFHEDGEVSGWRVKAQCRWATETEAGFLFLPDRFGGSISSRIARQHVRGRRKGLHGVPL